MRKRCYYEVLELGLTATIHEIKKSYYKLARKYHPDKNKSEEAKIHFQEINEAYSVLRDPDQKQFYDRHREIIIRNWNLAENNMQERNFQPSFDSPAFLTDDDSGRSFYTFYRNIFGTIKPAIEDINDLPCAQKDGESTISNQIIPIQPLNFVNFQFDLNMAAQFYSGWEGFVAHSENKWINLDRSDATSNKKLFFNKKIELTKNLHNFTKRYPRHKKYLKKKRIINNKQLLKRENRKTRNIKLH